MINKKYLKGFPAFAAFIFGVALLLEIFVWNYHFWVDRFGGERVVFGAEDVLTGSGFQSLGTDGAGRSMLCVKDSDHAFIELKTIPEKVGNIHFRLVSNAAEENSYYGDGRLILNCLYKDEGHSTFTYMPEFHISPFEEKSGYMHPRTYGKMLAFRVYPFLSEGSVLLFDSITINDSYPFVLSLPRLLFLFAACMFFGLFFAGKGRERLTAGFSQRSVKHAAAEFAIVLAFCAVLFLLCKESVKLTNIESRGYWNIFNQYNQLADAFLKGQSYLTAEVPEELKQMPNPYDRGYRDSVLASADGLRYLWDRAYYNGRYYVYFGVLPVVMFFLPYLAVTGKYLETAWVVLIYSVLTVFAMWRLVYAIFRRWLSDCSYRIYLLALIGAMAIIAPFRLMVRPGVYECAVIAGVCCVVAALWLWVSSVTKDSIFFGRFALGSFVAALTVAARPSMALFLVLGPVLIAEGLIADGLIAEGQKKIKNIVLAVTAYVLPMLPVAIFLMDYNRVRFGSVTDFGANYNLTVADMTRRGIDLTVTGVGLFETLFRSVSARSTFPYLNFHNFNSDYMGFIPYESNPGGMFFLFPVFTVLFYVFSRRFFRGNIWPRITARISLVIALITLILVTNMGGIVTRYRYDFVVYMIVATVMCLGELERRITLSAPGTLPSCTVMDSSCNNAESTAALYHGIIAALVFVSVISALLIFFMGFEYDIPSALPWLFYRVKHLVEFWH